VLVPPPLPAVPVLPVPPVPPVAGSSLQAPSENEEATIVPTDATSQSLFFRFFMVRDPLGKRDESIREERATVKETTGEIGAK
jgi:hypothetical protein